jgi:hypothetical protein
MLHWLYWLCWLFFAALAFSRGRPPAAGTFMTPSAARLAVAARKRGEDLGVLVNRLLKRYVELAEVLK